jgi:hypothetical protein
VLRSTKFDDGAASGFFADSGVWASSGGMLQVQAASLGGDAVAVYHVGDALPGYFEVQASISAAKPTGGWNANSSLVFDYQGKHDFKFAGLDVSINKLVMGHRDAAGWHVDEQAPIPGGVKPGVTYNLLLAVNGVNATLVMDNKNVFTHTYQPRVVDGYSFGLNNGMLGVGSNNSRGTFDNVRVQVLPPQLTFEDLEDFGDGAANLFTGGSRGDWTLLDGRYVAVPADGLAFSLLDLGPDHLNHASLLELSARVNTGTRAGLIFDRYGDESFKFAAIDAAADKLLIGHYTRKGGWAIDASASRGIDAGTDYTLGVTLKDTTVSLTLDGQVLLGYAFNASTVDGNFGLLAIGGPASFDDVKVRTNDGAFVQVPGAGLRAAEGFAPAGSASTLGQAQLDAVAREAMAHWTEVLGDGDPRLAAFGDLSITLADLGAGELGYAQGGSIWIDLDAAGFGWSSAGAMDPFSVVSHELGHVLGLEHGESGYDVMHETLAPQLRKPHPHADAVIDWQPAYAEQWTSGLSPYAAKPVKLSANLSEFLARPVAGYDELGQTAAPTITKR